MNVDRNLSTSAVSPPAAAAQAAPSAQTSFIARMAKVAQDIGSPTVQSRFFNLPVPSDPDTVVKAWADERSQLSARIGGVPLTDGPGTGWEWENTAKTPQDLIKDANKAKAPFESFMDKISRDIPGVEVNFGPNKQFMMKSAASLNTKLQSMAGWSKRTPEACAPLVNDMLRGTIIAENPESMKEGIKYLSSLAKKEGWEVTFNNKFEGKSFGGYVGINAKLKITFNDETGPHTIMCEIQLHFKQVFDGTPDCPKELSHKIYEVSREIGNKPNRTVEDEVVLKECNASSHLLYLTAMRDVGLS